MNPDTVEFQQICYTSCHGVDEHTHLSRLTQEYRFLPPLAVDRFARRSVPLMSRS